MKKVLLFCLALCAALSVQAQDFPYSKYLSYSRKDFKENNFKYDDYTNTWSLRRTNGLMVTFNVIAVLADGLEDIRPAKNDYSIIVQMGDNHKASYVKVVFYNSDTYHKLLTFLKDNGSDIVETSSGKLIRYQAYYEGYALELDMEQHIISRTSARTIDPKAVKTVDESYNEYEFFIRTDVEPKSEYLDKQAAKQAKRDAKGKKKLHVEDMM